MLDTVCECVSTQPFVVTPCCIDPASYWNSQSKQGLGLHFTGSSFLMDSNLIILLSSPAGINSRSSRCPQAPSWRGKQQEETRRRFQKEGNETFLYFYILVWVYSSFCMCKCMNLRACVCSLQIEDASLTFWAIFYQLCFLSFFSSAKLLSRSHTLRPTNDHLIITPWGPEAEWGFSPPLGTCCVPLIAQFLPAALGIILQIVSFLGHS